MKTKAILSHQLITAALSGALLLNLSASHTPQTENQPGCYNAYDPGKYCEDCVNDEVTQTWFPGGTVCPASGGNPVNVASGSVQRTIIDLSATAGVGRHRLSWTRYGQSRFVSGNQWLPAIWSGNQRAALMSWSRIQWGNN